MGLYRLADKDPINSLIKKEKVNQPHIQQIRFARTYKLI